MEGFGSGWDKYSNSWDRENLKGYSGKKTVEHEIEGSQLRQKA